MNVLRRQARPRPPRRGLATLEVVLCLPVLVGLMAIIFTLASAGMTKSEASIEARYEAWLRREDRRANSRLQVTGSGGDVGRVLGFTSLGAIPPSTNTLPPDAGLIVEESRRPVPTAYPGYRGANLTAVETHRVLAGTWDWREVKFPDDEDDELIPDPRFAYFAPPGVDTVSQLANFGNGSSGSGQVAGADDTFTVGDSEYGLGELAQKLAGIGVGGGNDAGGIASSIGSPGTIVDVAKMFGVSLADLAKAIPGVGAVVGVLEDVGDAIGDALDAINPF